MKCFLIAAITVDGFIAENVRQISTSWTSKEDKKFFSERSKQAGVVVMGSKTFATIGHSLPGRLTIVYSRSKPPKSDDPNLRFTNIPPVELISQLEKEGFSEVAICGGSTIYTLFLKAGLIQKMYLTIEPIIFGNGVKLFSEELQQRLKLVEAKKIAEDTMLFEYDVAG